MGADLEATAEEASAAAAAWVDLEVEDWEVVGLEVRA